MQDKSDNTAIYFGCTADEFSETLDTFLGVAGGATIAIRERDDTLLITNYSSASPETKSFLCPYCGTHYIARDPGFVPNCHNCGAIMRCEGV